MSSLITKAAYLICNGKLVAFPTETVYGIGANALNDTACQQIYQVKGRPTINPLIVHVVSTSQAKLLGKFNKDAEILTKFWPGPLTLVLPKTANCPVAKTATAGLSTIALRVPSYDIALQLLAKAKCPIAAPSANKSGKLSATTYQHVVDYFAKNDEIFILPTSENNEHTYGLESTILDLTTQTPTILRYGYITPEEISKMLGKAIAIAANLDENNNTKLKAPGMLLKHYAPNTKLRLNAIQIEKNEVGLNFDKSNLSGNFCLNLSAKGDLAEAAANLFEYLYQLDRYALEHNAATIAVAPVPNVGIGLAINDRLQRAAKN